MSKIENKDRSYVDDHFNPLNVNNVFGIIKNRIIDLDKQVLTILKDLKTCTDKKTEESYVKEGEKAYNEMIFLQSIKPINIKYVNSYSLYLTGNIYRDQAIKLGSFERTEEQVEIIIGLFSEVIKLYGNAIELENKQPNPFHGLILEIQHNLDEVKQAHKTLIDVLNRQPGEDEDILQPVNNVDENIGVIGANDIDVLNWQPGEDGFGA